MKTLLNTVLRSLPNTLSDNAFDVPATKRAIDLRQSHMAHVAAKAKRDVSRHAALSSLQAGYGATRLVLTGGDASNGLRAFAAERDGRLTASATINRALMAGATVGEIKRALEGKVISPVAKLAAHLSNIMYYGQAAQLQAAGCVISNATDIPATLLADGGPVLDRRHASKLAKVDSMRLHSPLLCVLHSVTVDVVVTPEEKTALAGGKVSGKAVSKASPAKATKKAATSKKKTA